MFWKHFRVFVLILISIILAAIVCLPKELPARFSFAGRKFDFVIRQPKLQFEVAGQKFGGEYQLRQGLDIQGGMQLVLRAQMEKIPEADRKLALDSVKEIIARRVDLFGVSEPVIQTSQSNNESRIIVELAGVQNPDQALQLLGTTAELDFRLMNSSPSAEATRSAQAFLDQFSPTGLTGQDLKASNVQFDQQNQPVVSLEFNAKGTDKFAKITTENTGQVLAIFLDGMPMSLPRINTPILDGRAIISGNFTLDQAKELGIQLNAGALPVPVEVIEQRSIGASLGQDAVQKSLRAGLIGLAMVMLFMIVAYGWKGVLASLSLGVYAVYTLAVYKLIGITITLPGLAGLLLTIGMAVDANILTFERMKEEIRAGVPFDKAMELGFGRAWDSIKDANVATLFTAFILINPFDFAFLNTSGLVRGFGLTLLIGVLLSLFTGLVVTRTLMRLFLKD